MDETLGSCQCGAVTFEISGGFDAFFLCHCARCRKDTGSSHAANLFSRTARIAWLSGGERIRNYRIPETRHEKAFCADCGSAPPRIEPEGLLVVPAGSLDTRIDIRPSAHICYASRAAWDNDLDGAPKIDGLPG